MLGSADTLNQSLEKAGRVADFFELGRAACAATPSTARSRCGGHFRVEHQTEDGEALRDDEHFAYVGGVGVRRASADQPTLHKEPLEFEYVAPRRSGATSERR